MIVMLLQDINNNIAIIVLLHAEKLRFYKKYFNFGL